LYLLGLTVFRTAGKAGRGEAIWFSALSALSARDTQRTPGDANA
jgi:hypothetical protein